MLLDDAVPVWDRRELHRVATDEPTGALFAAFDELTWAEVSLFKALMSLRGLGRGAMASDALVLDWFRSAGFVELDRTEDEILIVAVQPSRVRGKPIAVPDSVEAFRAFDTPRSIKIAYNFRVVDGYLATETRVRGTDARARRVFAAYWLGIRPFSGLIRRVWLGAVRSRARKAPAGR
ncbi:MAG: hypothetical protein L0K86_00725 [Actinomycetia bacterium]|nr:hypothetical protein [Actinomycetes bacterium]